MSEPSLSPEVKAIFDKLLRVLESDEAQNETLPEPFRSGVLNGINCDELPGARGAFGRSPENPIPVNGPLGQVLYLSRLRTSSGWKGLWAAGSPLMFHRVRSEDGFSGAVDVYEVLSVDGKVREHLFLSLYHPRKSRKVPEGYTLAAKLDGDNMTYGVNHIVENFPDKLDAYIRKWHMDTLGIPLPVSRVREAVNGSRMKPSVLAEERSARDGAGAQMRDDVLKLLHASKDPRFAGKNVSVGVDGIVRPLPETAISRDPPSGPRIFQSHVYDGDKPVNEWAVSRLDIVTVQTAHAIRQGVLGLKAPLVPGYWYECIYLGYFFLFFALMKSNFGGSPGAWADAVGQRSLARLIAVRFDREVFPEIAMDAAVRAYQKRHAEYFSQLGAFTADARPETTASFSHHLVHVFTGTRSVVLLAIPMLSLANEVLSQLVTSVAALQSTMTEESR